MDPKARAEHAFTEVEGELGEINQWMYDHPEIGFEEYDTSARLAEFLTDHGFSWSIRPTVSRRRSWPGPVQTVPRWSSAPRWMPSPRSAMLVDTTSLPLPLLGAGVALVPLVDQLGIRVTVLGTPAEEKMGGKVDLINAGAFAGAAASMMVHPSNSDVVDPNVLGVRHIDVEFHGKDSHAAFAPQLGHQRPRCLRPGVRQRLNPASSTLPY